MAAPIKVRNNYRRVAEGATFRTFHGGRIRDKFFDTDWSYSDPAKRKAVVVTVSRGRNQASVRVDD